MKKTQKINKNIKMKKLKLQDQSNESEENYNNQLEENNNNQSFETKSKKINDESSSINGK